ISHRTPSPLDRCSQASVAFRGLRIPRSNINKAKEFFDHERQTLCPRKTKHAEAKFRLGYDGNRDLGGRAFLQALAHAWHITFDRITGSIRIEEITRRHSEKPAFLRGRVIAI